MYMDTLLVTISIIYFKGYKKLHCDDFTTLTQNGMYIMPETEEAFCSYFFQLPDSESHYAIVQINFLTGELSCK